MSKEVFDCPTCGEEKTIERRLSVKDNMILEEIDRCSKCKTYHEMDENYKLIKYNHE